MHSRLIFSASIVLFLGVGMGAFGAHGLSGALSVRSMAVYQTAVNYQMWHGIGLAIIGLLCRYHPRSKLLKWAAWLMLAGIALFSGSLYVLSMAGVSWMGAITPSGGLLLLASWLLIAIFSWRNR